jgi:lactate racemase
VDTFIRFELPRDDEPLAVELPRAWLGQWVQPHVQPPASDPLKLIERAIDQPVGCPPLASLITPGQRVALVVDDVTRYTPVRLVLPQLLRRLAQAGVAAQDICIVIALGTHRRMTQAELADKLSGEIAASFPIVQSASSDQGEMVYAGDASNGIPAWVQRVVAEAHFRLGVGMITPHMDAGFSGGAKIILPGVCGAQTVNTFHARAVDDLENPLGDPQAPLRLALEKFVQERIPLDFIVNLVLTPQKQVFQCVAGDAIAAHRQGVNYARQVNGVTTPRRYPVVVANCAPYQHDLWQSCKGLWCGDLLTADGGTLVWVTQALQGYIGHPLLPGYIGCAPEGLKRGLDAGECEDAMSAATGVMIGRMKQRIHIVLVSDGLTPADAAVMGLDHFSSVESAITQAVNRLPPLEQFGSVAIAPQAGIILPLRS